ncbi:MAG TPA: hypothetical protein VMT18_09755 [Planctomycetota bacterium]|nr:hypothetical protein [Planctomycetota bacterium]
MGSLTLRRLRARRSRRGASLIEILISFTVLLLLVGLVAEAVTTSRGAYGQGMSAAAVEAVARRTVDSLAQRLTSASAASVSVDDPTPPPAANVITWVDFQTVQGFAGAPILAPQSRIQLELMAGEIEDGLDNNGNGMIDECRLVFVQDVFGGGPAIGLAGFVTRLAEGELANGADDNGDGQIDEAGFTVVWEPVTAGATGDRGGRLVLQLTLERASGPQTRVQRTVSTTVRVRSQ